MKNVKIIKLSDVLYVEKLNEKLVPELETGLFLSKWFYEQKTLRNMGIYDLKGDKRISTDKHISTVRSFLRVP